MHAIIHNREVVAMPAKEKDETGTKYVEPYERFGTEYGLFIPLTTTGYQFIRWVRRGMKDELPKTSISSYAIHISNDGEVFTMSIDTADDMIVMSPVSSKKFSLLTVNRDKAEALTYLMKDCKNIAEAVKIVDDGYPEGMHDPIILLVSDWVAYAKEKGYDKILYHTRFYE